MVLKLFCKDDEIDYWKVPTEEPAEVAVRLLKVWPIVVVTEDFRGWGSRFSFSLTDIHLGVVNQLITQAKSRPYALVLGKAALLRRRFLSHSYSVVGLQALLT